MNVSNNNVLVIGLGISGVSAIEMLKTLGANVYVFDGNESLSKEEVSLKVGVDAKNICLGSMEEEIIRKIQLAVVSPGVPLDIEVVKKVMKKEIPIWGEIELAYHFTKGHILAITGTNGKTTTTALLGEICKENNKNTFVVGNIGNPYTEIALETDEDTTIVAEVSSFQLETTVEFRPKVSAILNLTPDHLDRHHTMEAYRDAKFRIAGKQRKEDVCVLNYEDEVTRAFGEITSAKVIYFSSKQKLEKGVYLENNQIIFKGEKEHILCHIAELKLLGLHNYENIMAASAMAIAYGIEIELIKRVIRNFGGVAHRIEFICEKEGVQYYNDSKGTNPDAAIKGIEAMVRPTVLIGGGYDKDASFEEWIQAFDGKVKHLVLTGQTKEKIKEAANRCGFEDVVLAKNFEDAVNTAVGLAEEGDAILLSPACASWGEFDNYEKRGDKFRDIVKGL